MYVYGGDVLREPPFSVVINTLCFKVKRSSPEFVYETFVGVEEKSCNS